MASPIVITRKFPWTEKIDGHNLTFRLLTRDDRPAVEKMVAALPEEDIAFLRVDLREPGALDEYFENIDRGRTVTVMAEENGRLIGYGSLHHDEQLWSHHLGELRVLTLPEYRGLGLARRIIAELFHIANDMGLDRVFCQIPAHQENVRKMFENLGFQPEAFLREWLHTMDGKKYDLLIVARAVDVMGY